MNEEQTFETKADKRDKCRTCGATSSTEAWNMCNASGNAVCYGITLFPVDVRVGLVECGATGAAAIVGVAPTSTQKSA
ncbi:MULTISPECIES: hypothetical protein [Herbaspirillum]|uniref:Uncharacterized protein n=2 Tax=Herbaspirillum huttiense TaxID=863372 RepID=A0AAJ2LRM8_9BURK|nr:MULTISPECIES: hypothetical protein [Herbaspirillum]MDR9836927.1 hypothetical protein [Herbaspirillum huttiense]